MPVKELGSKDLIPSSVSYKISTLDKFLDISEPLDSRKLTERLIMTQSPGLVTYTFLLS